MAGFPAVFLDRDGVLIDEVHYLSRLDQIRLIQGAGSAIRNLNHAGVPVVVVTNQSGVARGLFSETFVEESHAYIADLLTREGARVDRFYYCPHHPEKGIEPYRTACACRKPQPGMLYQAARDLGLNLALSWMIGDKLSDLAAGAAAGCRTMLVRTGHGAKTVVPADSTSLNLECVVPALPDALDYFEKRRRQARVA